VGHLLRRPRRSFGLTIEAIGPRFGTEHLVDALAEAADLATFTGPRTRLLWPDRYDLRRIPLHNPTPVYPHNLLCREDNPHPGLTALRRHLAHAYRPADPETWVPGWA
jgi:hypothetical protein